MKLVNRKVSQFVAAGFIALTLLTVTSATASAADATPNFVIIFADDLGYGDLGCYGHPTIRTPNLDRMAAEGLRFTQFYVAECVCTPSRAGLLTGRLPIRSGMCGDTRRVLFPNSAGGLPAEEITLAEALHDLGYATACIGKWHLGHLPQYLPDQHGFDEFFGLPYSNDMDRTNDGPKGRAAFDEPHSEFWNVPLMRGAEVIERPADQTTLTRRYTEAAVEFIKEHRERPFFLYVPHTMVHVPLFRSPEFENRSARGLYGDCVEEVDWSVGRILDTLRELGLAENTLVWFSSDNGPWLTFGQQGGSAGLLREGKGSTWEGGMREPGIAWWPGHVRAGVVSQELAATLDILPTCVALAGGAAPTDRIMDGYDISRVLLEEEASPRDHVFYYRGRRLMAVRKGAWKAHFFTQDSYGPGAKQATEHNPPLLYNLLHDPSETTDVAAQHPEVIEEIRRLVADHAAQLVAPPSQLELTLP
ncbi:MAG: sulfatase [Planctomycetaceae bacterium]|nr:sulfatase [Planctomycetaceae bacterium]